MKSSLLITGLLCGLHLLDTRAHAQDEPVQAEGEQEPAESAASDHHTRRLRLLIGVGYGTQDDTDAPSFGEALALRVSYAPTHLLHLGAQGTFHVGSQFGDELNRVHYYGLEAGLSLALKPVTLTPYMMGGVAFVSSQRNTEASITTGYYGLGALLDFAVTEWLLAGADLRLAIFSAGVQQSDNVGDLATIDLLLVLGVLI